MGILIIFLLVFLMLIFFLTGKILLLLKDINAIYSQLVDWKSKPSKARITSQTNTPSIVKMLVEINGILNKQERIAQDMLRMEQKNKQVMTNLSHDFRTPITSALGYVQLAQDPTMPIDEQQQYLAIVEKKLHALATLSNNLFEFTKILEGRKAELEKVSVSGVLREAMAAYYADFVSAGFEMRLEIPNSPCYCVLERASLERIFQNLIGNALIHGKEWLSVQLVEKEENVQVIFCNRIQQPLDITAEELFDRFYTTDASRTKKNTGLGLAIVKSLAQKMDGKAFATLEGQKICIGVEFAKIGGLQA